MAKPLSISPERWQQIKRVYQDAIDRPPSEREQFLRDACPEDVALKTEVESLLAESDSAEGFLEQPAVDLDPPAAAEPALSPAAVTPPSERAAPQELPVPRVSSYKLLRKIGGGMGTAYLAVREDDEFKRRVVIKMTRTGFETEDLSSRFHREWQILAGLDHENIAKLMDGGTTEDGRPYLIMEYVDGQPIDRYCASQKLSVRERLILFRTICEAVHFAHQNLVLHRDLKPANVFVTAAGVPKLLDFGMSRLLNPELAPIDPTRMKTPDYASPEQARGEPVTTASDVYSLGVFLYELLTGHRPYRFTTRNVEEIAQVICEQEPARPSTVIGRGDDALTPESASRQGRPEKLKRKLTGDLDEIILMAMRKEPHRRYASIEHFSEDIQRHLDGRPVRARPDRFRYRTGKFVRRHKGAVAATLLLVLALVGGIAESLFEWRRAEARRVGTERRFHEVEQFASDLLVEMDDAVTNVPGGTPVRELLVRRGLSHLERLAKESADDPLLRRELAEAYRRLGDIQGNPRNSNLGDAKGALESYRAAERLVLGLETTDALAIRSLSLIYRGMGDVLGESVATEEARTAYGKAVDKAQAALALAPNDPETVRLVVLGQIRMGDLMLRTGRSPDEAFARFRSALRRLESEGGPAPVTAKDSLDRAVLEERLADVELMRGNYEKAVEGYGVALATHEAILATEPDFAPSVRGRALMSEKTAVALQKAGDTTSALESCRRADELQASLLAADPQNAELRTDVARVLTLEGSLEADAGRMGEAWRLTTRALSLAKANADREGASAFDLNAYAHALLNCRLEYLRQPRTALQYATRAVEMTQSRSVDLLGTLALAYFRVGEVARAVELKEKALARLPEEATELRQAGEKTLAEFKARAGRD